MKAIWLFFLMISTLYTSGEVTDRISNNDPVNLGKGQMPAMAADKNGDLHLVYGMGDSLVYRRWINKDAAPGEPELIAVVDGLFAFASRGPRIVSTPDGVTVIAPTQAGNVYCFVKTQRKGWSGPIKVTDVDSVNREGFVALASDGKQNLFAVWLDLRADQRNKIYGSRSVDGGKSWAKNTEIYVSPDSTVCECCQVNVAMNNKNVYVMFRNWLKGSRDLHLATSSNGGRSFEQVEKLGKGTWKLNGCPMDGGALALGRSNVETVWRREATIYSCRPGEAERAIGEGRNATIEMIDGRAVYAWTDKGKVVCLLPNGSQLALGAGKSVSLKAINNKQLACVWEHEAQLYLTIVQVAV